MPLQFKMEDLADIHEAMRVARLATVDRAGVVAGPSQSPDPREREVATRIPTMS